MHSSSQEMLPDGRVCWVAVRIPQRVSPSAPGGHLLVSSFLAITRRASVNVPIVVFVWSINLRFPGTNIPMCNCLVVWQLQVLRRMPGCFSEWLRRFLLPSAGQRKQNTPSLWLASICCCPSFTNACSKCIARSCSKCVTQSHSCFNLRFPNG